MSGDIAGIRAGTFKAPVNGENIRDIGSHGSPSLKSTTVGFEHEFAQFHGGMLEGLSHMRIGDSKGISPSMPGFALETDADNVLELISPPFTIKALRTVPIPDPRDVHRLATEIRQCLHELVAKRPQLGHFIECLREEAGLSFELRHLCVDRENVTPGMKAHYSRAASLVSRSSLAGICLSPCLKGRSPGILTHINFATDAATCDRLQQLAPPDKGPYQLTFSALQARLMAALHGAEERLTGCANPRLALILRFMARTLSGELAIPSMSHVKAAQERIYNAAGTREQRWLISETYSEGHSAELFRFHRAMTSKIKDVSGFWIRDTIWNIALGVLTRDDWSIVRAVVMDPTVQSEIMHIGPAPFFGGLLNEAYLMNLAIAKDRIRDALFSIGEKAGELASYDLMTLRRSFIGPTERLPRLEYFPSFLGARQDTYLSAEAVQMPSVWPDKRLHVVELRQSPHRRLEHLYADYLQRTEQALDNGPR
jgi:hypothetical protein